MPLWWTLKVCKKLCEKEITRTRRKKNGINFHYRCENSFRCIYRFAYIFLSMEIFYNWSEWRHKLRIYANLLSIGICIYIYLVERFFLNCKIVKNSSTKVLAIPEAILRSRFTLLTRNEANAATTKKREFNLHKLNLYRIDVYIYWVKNRPNWQHVEWKRWRKRREHTWTGDGS